MKIKNLLLIFSVLLFTSACGVKIAGMPGEGGGLNNDLLEKAQDELCVGNEKLQEYPSAIPRLGDLMTKTKIFAFTKANAGDCILKQSLNDSWKDSLGTQLWFNLNPNSACFKNDSLWVVEKESYSGVGRYYSLINFEDRSLPLVEMNGHVSVPGDYLKEVVGLRLLVCR